MSKNETWLTRRYWERVGGRGTLLEEDCVVKRRPGVSARWLDGVIILWTAFIRSPQTGRSTAVSLGMTSSLCRRRQAASACTCWGRPCSRAS